MKSAPHLSHGQDVQPTRPASEIDRELDALDCARKRLDAVLTNLGGHLQDAGVLVSPRPESAEGIGEAENIPGSQLGSRIRGVRSDLHNIADDFERLLSRLAI